MKIERRFTTADGGPYEGMVWEARRSEIRNPDGKLIFSQDAVVVPSFWSQIATDIIAQKYFRKAGVPKEKALAWQQWAPLGKGPGRQADPGRKLPTTAASTTPARSSTDSPTPGCSGARKTTTSIPKKIQRLFTMRPASCSLGRWRLRTVPNGSIRGFTRSTA